MRHPTRRVVVAGCVGASGLAATHPVQDSEPPSDTTGVLLGSLRRDQPTEWDFVPARIDGTGRPVPLDGAEAARVRDDLRRNAPGADPG